jgi:hypothetical protein
MLLAGRSRVRDLIRQLNVVNLPNPSGRTRPSDLLSFLHKLVPETEINDVSGEQSAVGTCGCQPHHHL